MPRLAAAIVAVLAAAIGPAGTLGAAAAEKIVVGTNAEFPPFEFLDKQGRVVGFDIDLVKAVGDAAGFTVEIRNLDFDALVDALVDDKVDIVAAGMTINDERRKLIDFSDPYYNAAQVIVVRENTAGYQKIDDIKAGRAAVQRGTTGATMAEEVMGKENPKLRRFQTYHEAFAELKGGRVDAVIVDSPVAAAYLQQIPGLRISSPPMSEEHFGLGIAKGRDELRQRVNRALAAVRESGEYGRLIEKWFGEEAVPNSDEEEEDKPADQAAPAPSAPSTPSAAGDDDSPAPGK